MSVQLREHDDESSKLRDGADDDEANRLLQPQSMSLSSSTWDDDEEVTFEAREKILIIDDESTTVPPFSWKKLWLFTGPGFLMSIAFLDPGNLEGDLQLLQRRCWLTSPRRQPCVTWLSGSKAGNRCRAYRSCLACPSGSHTLDLIPRPIWPCSAASPSSRSSRWSCS